MSVLKYNRALTVRFSSHVNDIRVTWRVLVERELCKRAPLVLSSPDHSPRMLSYISHRNYHTGARALQYLHFVLCGSYWEVQTGFGQQAAGAWCPALLRSSPISHIHNNAWLGVVVKPINSQLIPTLLLANLLCTCV